MTDRTLQEAISSALARLAAVDRTDPAAMFDCLVEVEMLAHDAVAAHGAAQLMKCAGQRQGLEKAA